MATSTETSDALVLDLLRREGAMSVGELGRASQVTATAVRQRLTRLMSQGLVERVTSRQGRGRPLHRYSLSEKGRRERGTNFNDLAMALWDEIRAVKDPEVRRGLLERLSRRLAGEYRERITGGTSRERMEALKGVFAERRVPLEVVDRPGFPALQVVDCPYPELAEKDRGVCSLERMLFAELVAAPLRLSQCRLDGHTCCQFESGGGAATLADSPPDGANAGGVVPEPTRTV